MAGHRFGVKTFLINIKVTVSESYPGLMSNCQDAPSALADRASAVIFTNSIHRENASYAYMLNYMLLDLTCSEV